MRQSSGDVEKVVATFTLFIFDHLSQITSSHRMKA
jgi:hypothetical protein